MYTHPPRLWVLRAHLLEMIISAACIGLGAFMWISMSGANSGVNLLAGAALLVAGFIVFIFAMKSVLRYQGAVLVGLLIAVAGLMAAACFGLAVLLISVVGWLWPAKSEGDGSVLRLGRKLS